MIVAAHQPHYLPWLGYLAKVAAADVFVVMDDLQYEEQNFQNRNRVKCNHGPIWLTVPLAHGAQSERINEKYIANSGSLRQHWQRRHFETLRIHYQGAPHWRDYEPELRDLYSRHWDRLIELDLHILQLHLRWFDIRKPIVLASSLQLAGQKTDRILALCRAVGATTYLSGGGGSRGYLDIAQLGRAGVGVEWQTFAHPRHPQRYPGLGFTSHLAALDLLLNCGPRGRDVLAESAAPARTLLAAVR
ncbi:MAG TPA: WbqC family protein [Polyangia bacterium]|nr:WbqC family protein [Polyangia bacterium]